MDISHFVQSIGDKAGKVFGFNPVLENIVMMKVAIILISISLLISSLALLVLVISHCRSKNSLPFDFDSVSIPEELNSKRGRPLKGSGQE
ncbi:MAG: hypothetical protein ABSF90_29765 [Syntrophobacteraceae bacterium]